MSTPDTPYAKCGCGFEVRGFDQTGAIEMFNDHECATDPLPTRWYQAAFSPWAALILIVLVTWLPDLIKAWKS